MKRRLERFEAVARLARNLSTSEIASESTLHAFDQRNIHTGFPRKVRKQFDDGHYAEATFEAFKYLDKKVQKHAGISECTPNAGAHC
jgi:hypothetical protein